MFDLSSLSKLTDEIPEDLKDKLKDAAMEKLGLSKPNSSATPEASSADTEDQPQSDDSSDAQGNDDTGQ